MKQDPYPPYGVEFRWRLTSKDGPPNFHQLARHIAASFGLTIEHKKLHVFKNGGATLTAILKESHLAIEWWPRGVCMVWVVSCRRPEQEQLTALSRVWILHNLKVEKQESGNW